MSDKAPPQAQTEPDQIPTGTLFLWFGATCAGIIVLIICAWSYYKSYSRALVEHQQLTQRDPVLQKARADEQAALASYGLVDQKKGLYRIPIAQAINQLLNNRRLLLPKPMPPQPVPTPGTAPAAPGAAPAAPGAAAPTPAAAAPTPAAAPSTPAAPTAPAPAVQTPRSGSPVPR